jgi:hypothetical protein
LTLSVSTDIIEFDALILFLKCSRFQINILLS